MTAETEALRARARAWLEADPDPATQAELAALVQAGDDEALHERFDSPLVFGTAGLRAALGAGPARMNRVVVRATTAGLARWVLDQGEAAARAGIVVGRDARHGSSTFAADVVAVAAEAGVRVQHFSRPLPTPLTAFAVRELGARAGVMVTASHNPPQDNGYKAYVADGAQIIPPDDARVAALATELGAPPATELSNAARARIEPIDEERLLTAYAEAIDAVLDRRGPRQISVVYTPMHGVGGAVVPDLFVRAGFAPPFLVPEQASPDPDFPTVNFPNPEEPGALDLALAAAQREHADLVIANDPDADRLAIAVRDHDGLLRVLSGNELGAILGAYRIERSSGSDRLVATTIVSSSLLGAIAAAEGVDYAETLTGFKWIARAAATRPGRRLLFGYEEALGYAVSDAVADKDGVSAALLTAELAAREREMGRTLLDRLDDLALAFGVHATAQLSLRRDGPEGAAEIATMMKRLRADPPAVLGDESVTAVTDYLEGIAGLPPADVLAFSFGHHARVVIRPSGTEPKLKGYLEVRSDQPARAHLEETRRRANAELSALTRALDALLAS